MTVSDPPECPTPKSAEGLVEGEPPGGLLSMIVHSRTFTSLHDRDFRWFFIALLSQNAAMNIQLLARGYLVYELTGSYAALGVVALVHAMSMLVLSPYGGLLADGRSKRVVLQAGQSAAAVQAAAVGALLLFDVLRYEHLLLAALAQGITTGLMMPSRQSMAPEIVGRARLMNAVSLNTAGMNVMRLLGPALAGIMLAIFDAELVYFTMSGLFALSVLTLARVPRRAPDTVAGAGTASPAQAVRDLRDGLAYIWRTPVVLQLLIITFITSLLAMPYIRLLPGFVADVLDGGATELGFLFSVAGAGSLLGALVLASLPPRRRGVILLASTVGMAVSLVAFSSSSILWVSFVTMFAVGVGSAGRQALSNVLIQLEVEDAYRGRVMSVWLMQVGMMSLGAFIIGVSAEFVGPQVALGGAAALLIVLGIAVYLFVPRIRTLD